MVVERILFICNASYVFGAERITLSLIEGLKKKGYTIHCIVSGWNNGDFIAELNKIGVGYDTIKLGWIYISKWQWTLDALIHFPGAIIKYLKVVRKFKPDLCFHYLYRSVFQLFLFTKVPIICSIHDTSSKDKVTKFCLQVIRNKVSVFLACSAYIKQDLLQCGIDEGKVAVVHNFINTDVPLKNIFFKPIDSEKKYLEIGIVGQVIAHKGHEIAIRAIAALHKEGKSVRLHIFGSGDTVFIENLKKLSREFLIESLIVWHGYKTNQNDIYEKLDLVIVPTLRPEPFGMVAIEPVRFGVPVIASGNGGLKEIIVNGETGYLFKPNDVPDLVSKINMLIDNPAIMNSFALKAVERVNEHFVSYKQIPKVESIIQAQFS